MDVRQMEEEKKMREARDKKRMEAPIKAFIKAFKRTVTRHNKIEDPVMRSLIKFEKFNMAITIGLSLMDQFAETEDLSGNIQSDLQQIIEEFYKDLDEISEQIENFNLSPDHRYGKSVMKLAEKDFSEKKE